jgi:hypothetical protein
MCGKPAQISTGKEISESECTFSVGSIRSGTEAGSLAAAGECVAADGVLGAAAAAGVAPEALVGADFDVGGVSAAEPARPAANPRRIKNTGAVLMIHSA